MKKPRRNARLADAEFDRRERALIGAARKVRAHAHAPYSKFRVGAAVMDARGRIHVGCNVENASYGLTVCAERNAVAAAVAAGATRIEAVAVVTDGKTPAYPCGACRQVLAEFGDVTVFVAAARGGSAQDVSLTSTLLPRAFKLQAN